MNFFDFIIGFIIGILTCVFFIETVIRSHHDD